MSKKTRKPAHTSRATGPTKVLVDIEREIGTRLKLARLAQRMSQQELGEVFGLSFQQIQKYEKGTNRIAGSRMVQLAEVLKTTPHQLLGWQKEVSAAIIDPDIYEVAKHFMRVPSAARPHLLKLVVSYLEMAGK